VSSSTVVVAVDVGKSEFAVSVTDAARVRLVKPMLGRSMSAPSLRSVVSTISASLQAGSEVKVGVEAAGHYHLPLLSPAVWPAGWELLELNPAHVTEMRRVLGKRSVKTDATDLNAMTELLLAGRGQPVTARGGVLSEIRAWSAHRSRRVHVRAALKNQLLGQLDRSFPGLTLALPDVLGTKVGRLVAAEFADPQRLAALGVNRFIRFGANRGLQIRKPLAERLVATAHETLPMPDAAAARAVLTSDLALLEALDQQIAAAETEFARLIPASPFRTLTTVPGWGVTRVANYAAAVGEPSRWPGPRQLYRAAGLNPIQYESAGKRRDNVISREGSVELRRALIGFAFGLWTLDAPSKAYAQRLKARGKPGGVIGCAIAHRANRIAFALVRDHADYDPAKWMPEED
jgi:transposase